MKLVFGYNVTYYYFVLSQNQNYIIIYYALILVISTKIIVLVKIDKTKHILQLKTFVLRILH